VKKLTIFLVACILYSTCNNSTSPKTTLRLVERLDFPKGKWVSAAFPVVGVKAGQVFPDSTLAFAWYPELPPDKINDQYRPILNSTILEIGRGYWIKNDSVEFSITVDSLDIFDLDSATVNLYKGWHFIGNPYPYRHPLPGTSLIFVTYHDSVLAKISSLQDLELWNYDTVGHFEPWTGYWVECEVDSISIVFRKSLCY